MQIWRMKPTAASRSRSPTDDYNNWFPHPSPDGKWIVFLSYEKGRQGPPGEQGRDAAADARRTEARSSVLAKLFGGQGTINVPSWSPDSGHVAFVSYRLVNP